MTQLYLIRHGQAVVNVVPIIGGMKGDTGLTELGVEQAGRLRDRLAATGEIKADVLLASPMPRARQTAEIIAPALGLPIEIVPELKELNPGEADGMTFADYQAKYGPFSFDMSKPISPGGETWPTFMERISGVYARIAAEYPGKIVVAVCHGWVIEGSFSCFFGLETANLPSVEFQVANTSITQWERFSRRDEGRWRLKRYNDDIHLRSDVLWQATIPDSAEGIDKPAVPLPGDPPAASQGADDA